MKRSPTSRPLTTISRRAAQPKLIGCPLSRTTRMPSVCLPRSDRCARPRAPSGAARREADDQVGEEAEDARHPARPCRCRPRSPTTTTVRTITAPAGSPGRSRRAGAAAPARQRLAVPARLRLRDRLLPATRRNRPAVAAAGPRGREERARARWEGHRGRPVALAESRPAPAGRRRLWPPGLRPGGRLRPLEAAAGCRPAAGPARLIGRVRRLHRAIKPVRATTGAARARASSPRRRKRRPSASAPAARSPSA